MSSARDGTEKNGSVNFESPVADGPKDASTDASLQGAGGDLSARSSMTEKTEGNLSARSQISAGKSEVDLSKEDQSNQQTNRSQATPRNPITGIGLGGDGVGGVKTRKTRTLRGGNPVTGEGYSTTANSNSNDSNPSNSGTTTTSTNTPTTDNSDAADNNDKNYGKRGRVPPGGFSSGLW